MATLTDIERAGFYGGKVNLWVEDKLTRDYLTALWDDPEVKLPIGGGRHGIQALLREAEELEYRNVFGLVDRDYGKTNFEDWAKINQTFLKFILPCHEIDNYLLDTAALAECPSNQRRSSHDEINAFLKGCAEKLCWWVACCDVIAQIAALSREHSIPQPKGPVIGSEVEATQYIVNSLWFQNLPVKLIHMTPDESVSRLGQAHSRAAICVQDGRWRSEFPGKEIFRQICDYLYHHEINTRRKRLDVLTADFAKEIAAQQRADQAAITGHLTILRAALKARIS